MTASSPAWQVAVPTYRRPGLLQRALSSLLAQTEPRWQATVYDDSPDREARAVVESIGDARIRHVGNALRLGAAGNIDRCFGRERLQGPGLGLVLEDDNFLLPDFFAFAGEQMTRTGAWMALFNQRIWSDAEGMISEARTTRGAWFSDGWVSPFDLHASLLLFEGLSNGGIVWRLDGPGTLEVGRMVTYTSLHEFCRSLLVHEPFWFSSRALSVWTANSAAETARKGEVNRIITRGRQTITRTVLHWHGRAAVYQAARKCSEDGPRRQLVSTLLHAGFLGAAFAIDARMSIACLGTAAKGALSRALVADPCAAFVSTLAARQP